MGNDNYSDVEEDLKRLVGAYGSWVLAIQHADREDRYQEHAKVSIEYNQASPPDSRANRADVRAGSLHPPRDATIGDQALLRAGYQCEFCGLDETFMTNADNQYMEKHHIIPMNRYFSFDLSIDHPVNIVCLCPLCHRRVHHAVKSERTDILKALYEANEGELVKHYDVSWAKLRKYYRV